MLPQAQWLQVVERTPLVSIDLILQDAGGRVLLGLRRNQPARGFWFVPGGVIRKDETLDQAYARIALTELGWHAQRDQARLLGVYEHFYDNNFAEAAGVRTHYVVLAHRCRLDHLPQRPADAQHESLCSLTPAELLASDRVHPYTKAYFQPAA